MGLGRRLMVLVGLGGAAYWLARYLTPAHSTLVLNDKVVIITGASSGVGRAMAFAFARRAARVVLVARREERLKAVRREIEPYTSDVLVIPADLTDDAQLESVIDRTLAHFGRIDVLVNNAGISQAGPLQELDPARIDRLLDLNLRAVIRLTQLALPSMLAQREGYILNVGSALGRSAAPLFAPYTASKYGLAGFTDSLRRELHGTGVQVTLVQPGWVHTEMLTPDIEELVERRGFQVEHPDTVAERAVLALVRGEREVILGGLLPKLGVLVERFAPLLLRMVWLVLLTPEWREVMRQLNH